jgi:predicted secreted protein
MYIFTKILLFILIWWIIFFISLPFNISIPENQIKGHASSSPKKTYIGLKVIISSAISVIIMFFLLILQFDLGTIFRK